MTALLVAVLASFVAARRRPRRGDGSARVRSEPLQRFLLQGVDHDPMDTRNRVA